jgi:hypothetical protein
MDRRRRLDTDPRKTAQDPRAARAAQARHRGYRQRQRSGAFWGVHTGPNPTDRAKKGCKRHVITDGDGVPLTMQTTPANANDGKMVIRHLGCNAATSWIKRQTYEEATSLDRRRGVRQLGQPRALYPAERGALVGRAETGSRQWP